MYNETPKFNDYSKLKGTLQSSYLQLNTFTGQTFPNPTTPISETKTTKKKISYETYFIYQTKKQ